MEMIKKAAGQVVKCIALAAMCVAGSAMAAPATYTFSQGLVGDDMFTPSSETASLVLVLQADAGLDGVLTLSDSITSATLTFTGTAGSLVWSGVSDIFTGGVLNWNTSEALFRYDHSDPLNASGIQVRTTPQGPLDVVLTWDAGQLITSGSSAATDAVWLINTSPSAVDPIAGSFAAQGAVAVATAPVPEPESYALMLAGLGVLGALARRRKQ